MRRFFFFFVSKQQQHLSVNQIQSTDDTYEKWTNER